MCALWKIKVLIEGYDRTVFNLSLYWILIYVDEEHFFLNLGSNITCGLQAEDIANPELYSLVMKDTYKSDSFDGIPAKCLEACCYANLISHSKSFLHSISYYLFILGLWLNISVFVHYLWHRKSLTVNLAIDCHRNSIKCYKYGWNHVISKLLGHILAQIFTYLICFKACLHSFLECEVQDQLILSDISYCLLYSVVIISNLLNFTKLYSEAAKLNLIIYSAHILKLIVSIVSYKVTSLICSKLVSSNCYLYETVAGKFILIPVTLCNLRSCQVKLTYHLLRKELAIRITYKAQSSRNSSTDRNIFLISVYYIVGRTYCKLSWSIAVYYLESCSSRRKKLLATHHQVIEVKILIILHKFHTNKCGYSKTSNLVLCYILIHLRNIPTEVFTEDVKCCTNRKWTNKVIK